MFWKETIAILEESAPYLLAGFLLAGLLNVVLSRYPRITSALTGPGKRPVFLAALLGAPLPLCSCSVIPSALTLRKQGASKGTVASFLISVPETDVVSIALTYALLGPVMAAARPLSAVFSAILAGLAVDRWAGAETSRPALPSLEETQAVDPPKCGDCDCGPDVGSPPSSEQGRAGWIGRALHFGFVEMFDDIIVQILIGIVIAGAVVAWLPGLDAAASWGRSPSAYLVMLVLGIPLYVCASASTPLALGLVVGGVSPGAALVFLLTGPATNMASLVVLGRQMGARALALYLAAVAIGALACGVLLDLVFSAGSLPISASAAVASGAQRDGFVGVLASGILLVLSVWSIHRTRRLPRVYASIRRRVSRVTHR
jgi:uncharacterized membrane protein YraQ (UPF0718 family)